jgi:hypothetical protein
MEPMSSSVRKYVFADLKFTELFYVHVHLFICRLVTNCRSLRIQCWSLTPNVEVSVVPGLRISPEIALCCLYVEDTLTFLYNGRD